MASELAQNDTDFLSRTHQLPQEAVHFRAAVDHVNQQLRARLQAIDNDLLDDCLVLSCVNHRN